MLTKKFAIMLKIYVFVKMKSILDTSPKKSLV